MGLFNFFKKKQSSLPVSTQPSLVADQLEQLGYFKYAAPADIPELKAALIESLTSFNYLGTVTYMESPFNSKDYRHYHFDGEDLFEEGGFIWQLKAMETLFQKMDFRLDITNHVEDWSKEKGLNHRITLNGKEYIIFKNFNADGWGEAAQRFAEIINDQLALQNKDELLFLANSGNDGNAVFLTEEQFALLDPILNGIERPMRIEGWCKLHEVDPMAYNQP